MKKLFNFLQENFLSILGIVHSIFAILAIYKDVWGDGNPQNAAAWIATLIVWCLVVKMDVDRKRTKEIKDRLDILARVLLPEFCKGNYETAAYKKLIEKDGIAFEEDTWYPCYFKPIGGQIRAHEVLDGLYNPFKKIFKLDPKFKENVKESCYAYLEDHVWFQNNVLEYTLKDVK